MRLSGNARHALDSVLAGEQLRAAPFRRSARREARANRLEPFVVSPFLIGSGDCMDRPQAPRAPTRTLAQLEDSQDLEAVISAALAARPIDESMLRRGVWTYVSEEQRAGTSPGRVILTLTELIEKTKTTSKMEQQAVMRRVILWCVEAYFGHLGGRIDGGLAAG
jgi:hypothetical protein